jgi:hypothetical protein
MYICGRNRAALARRRQGCEIHPHYIGKLSYSWSRLDPWSAPLRFSAGHDFWPAILMRQLAYYRLGTLSSVTVEFRKGTANRQDVTSLTIQPRDPAGLWRGNLDYCFLRLDRDQRLISHHVVALAHMPGNDLGLRETFTQIWQAEGLHVSSTNSVAAWTMSATAGM